MNELKPINHMHENSDCAWCANEAKYPNPIAIMTGQISTSFAKEKETYIFKAFQEVGINPQVIIEQQALIATLKSDILSLREQIAQEIEVYCKENHKPHQVGERDCWVPAFIARGKK